MYNLSIKKAFDKIQSKNYTELSLYYLIDVPKNHLGNLSSIIKKMRSSGVVDILEYNEVMNLHPLDYEQKNVMIKQKSMRKRQMTNDPRTNDLWGFDILKVGALFQYMNDHNIKPKKKVTIAILDTGIDQNHEDIKPKYVSIKPEYDKDFIGHGTHCAGIAASVTNNKKGIASLTPNNDFVQVTSVKIINNKDTTTTDAKVIAGIIEACDNGADVVSISISGTSKDNVQVAYAQAIKYAKAKGVIVVVAAGNRNDSLLGYVPASIKGVIVVTAIDQYMNKAYFSNYVTDTTSTMAVAAPGVTIMSTYPDNKYVYLNGTSMAAPYVAGLVGLLKSVKPNLQTQEVYEILKSTGISTRDAHKTGKLIQPLEALKKVLNR